MARHPRLWTLVALLVLPLAACGDDAATAPSTFPGTIRGLVTIEEQPAGGVTVSLSGAAQRTTSTDGAGAYQFADLEVGSYEVAIGGFADDVNFSTTSRAAVLTEAAPEGTADFTGSYLRTSSVAVSVKADGSSLSGVAVSLRGTESATGQTDASGQATFSGLRAGSYTVDVSGLPGDVTLDVRRESLEVGAGESATVDFTGQYQRTSSVSVSVSANGRGVEGVAVSLVGEEGALEVRTGSLGEASFSALRSGNYTVTLSDVPDAVTLTSLTESLSVGVGQGASVRFTGTRIATSSVAITSITSFGTDTPVDPAAVRGLIDVEVALDPGNETPQVVEAFVGDERVFQEFFPAAAPGARSDAFSSTLNIPISTGAFSRIGTRAAVRFRNETYPLRVTFQTLEVGEAAAVQDVAALTFANDDRVLVDIVPGRSAQDGEGREWIGQGMSATFTHLAYSGTEATGFTSSFVGLPRTTNPAVWTASDLAGRSPVFPTGELPVLSVTALVDGAPGPTAAPTVRYDGLPPQAVDPFTLTEQALDGTVRGVSNRWLSPGYRFADGAPVYSDQVPYDGVGGEVVTYHAGPEGMPLAEVWALPPVETPAEAGLGPSGTNTAYRVWAVATDALGNQRGATPHGGPGVTIPLFGVDATPPTGQAVTAGSVADRTIYNAGVPEYGPFAAGTIELTAVDDLSGFGPYPVARSFRYSNAADGVVCLVGAAPDCTPTQGPLAFATDNTDVYPGAGAVTEAYYQYQGEVYDQAGQPTGTTSTRTYLFDETAPVLGPVAGLPATVVPGGTLALRSTATDNVDLRSGQGYLVFPGLTGTNLDAIPFTPVQTLGSGWDFEAPSTRAAVSTTTPAVTHIEPSDGAGAPSGVLVLLRLVRFAAEDVAGNETIRNDFVPFGSIEPGVSLGSLASGAFPAGARFRQTTARADICYYGDRPCPAPAARTVTLTAEASGPSGSFPNPFAQVFFAYVDNVDVGGSEFTHRYIGVDATATMSDDGILTTWSWSVEMPASVLELNPAGLDYVLPIQAIGVNRATGTGLLAVTGTAVIVIDNF